MDAHLGASTLTWINRPRPLTLRPMNAPADRPWSRVPGPALVVMRGAEPADAPSLAAMHSRCSMETVYRRYFSAVPAVSRAWQQHLLSTQVALVATSADGLHALGDLASLPDGSMELALLVEDRLQNRGLGTAMGRHLAASARLLGHRVLSVRALSSSASAHAVVAKIGPATAEARDGAVTLTVRLGVEALRGIPEPYEHTAGAVTAAG